MNREVIYDVLFVKSCESTLSLAKKMVISYSEVSSEKTELGSHVQN